MAREKDTLSYIYEYVINADKGIREYVSDEIAKAQIGGDVDLNKYALKSDLEAIELIPGPKGDTGPQGPKGDTGPAGKDGTPADLSEYAQISYVDNKIADLLEIIGALQSRIEELEGGTPIEPPEEPSTIPCTNISLDKTSLTFNDQNGQRLTATVAPSNTTDTISWSTSSSAIATVYNGMVTPKANGSCVITVTCGSKSATCNVSVNMQATGGGGNTGDGTEIPCTKISVYPTKYTFEEIAGWQVPVVTLTPSNTTDVTKWSTNDPTVATVTSAGVIQPKGNGSCTITATCGSQVATVSVTVNDANVGVTLEDFNLDKPLTITSKDDYAVEIIPEPESLRGYGSARWYTSAINVLGMRHYEGTGSYTDKPTTQTLYPGQNGTATITVEYDLGTKGSMTKDFEITVAIPDDTEDTAILFDNPIITMEGIKAKATQDGVTQYFDVSGEPNTGHVSYNSYIELTDSNNDKYYLALTNKGTSPFGKNGLHLDSGGWYSNGSDVCTKYEPMHSVLYFNDFNMNLKVENINNSIPTDLLDRALSLFNQTIPNLNMTTSVSSSNTIEMISVDENWLGGCSMFNSTKNFVIQINQFRLSRKYGEYGISDMNIKQWLSTVVHEFGHTLGAKDNAAHYPALLTYNRDSEAIYFLQPNDIAWIEHVHESTYGISLMTTQEEYEAQVANLDIEALSQIVMDDQYNFDYAQFDEDDADLIVDCKLEYVETKEINISRTDKEVLYEYRIYNIVDENIIKGEMTNRQVKIHVSQLADLDTSNRYRLYLSTYENTPCSLLDPEQGIKVI